MPFYYACELCPHFSRRLADRNGTRDIRRAIGELATAIHQIKGPGRQFEIAFFRHAIMRKRGIALGAGNRVEGQIAQFGHFHADGFQLACRLDLIDFPGLGFRIQPVQESGDCCAVADMRLARSFNLGFVLGRLRAHDRVFQLLHSGAATVQLVINPGRRR